MKNKCFLLLLTHLLIFTLSNSYSQVWSPMGSCLNSYGQVSTICSYNGTLYMGGHFLTAAGECANCIASWNGTSWSQLGSGITGYVNGMYPYKGELYVTGNFTNVGSRIAKWNGSSWSTLGSGLNDWGNAFTIYGTTLYIAGEFKYGGGITSWRIVGWNGSSFVGFPSGLDYEAKALTVFKNELIIGGTFDFAAGVNVQKITRWNGTSFSTLGSGMNDVVFSLAVYKGDLIAGGYFTTAGGVSANKIAKWNGTSWSPLGSGLNGTVYAMAVYNNQLIVGGDFTTAGGNPANKIAKWNGGSWSALGSGVNGTVYGLFPYNGDLIAGGNFTAAGSVSANKIAKWNDGGNRINQSRHNINKQILDNQNTYDTITISNDILSGYVADVNIVIDSVIHPNVSDLEISLIHQGVADTTIYRVGGSGGNFIGTTLDDDALISISSGSAPFTGFYAPAKPLLQFLNTDPAGIWILRIRDDSTGNTGTLKAWSINVLVSPTQIGIKQISEETPSSFSLFQNYPNPFNPSTNIKFGIAKSENVILSIYDIRGREITTLVNETLSPGTYETSWDASGFSSGVYYYRLTVEDPTGRTGDFTQTKKMVLLK